MTKLRVGILFGGKSGEHDVSLMSAKEVIAAIDTEKYEIIPIGVTKAGKWQLTSPETLHNHEGPEVSLLADPNHQALLPVHQQSVVTETDPQFNQPLDIIFPLIHGTYGEDGCLQGLLELANLPYVGSGVLGSAVGMDKVIMKSIFAHSGLNVTPYQWVWRRQWHEHPKKIQQEIETVLKYPLFIKPASLGSSVGISKVNNSEQFAAAMDNAARYDRKIIIESAIESPREIEVGVLGNDHPIASVPGEIVPSNEFYDYEAKYLSNKSVTHIPADLSKELITELKNQALRAFKAVGCEGLARIDFLVRRADSKIFISEINTLPGFTQHSMYPKLMEAIGINYRELIDRLLHLGLERHRELQQNCTTFQTTTASPETAKVKNTS